MLRRYLLWFAAEGDAGGDDHQVAAKDNFHAITTDRVSITSGQTVGSSDAFHAVFDYRVFAGKPFIAPKDNFHAVTSPSETVYEDQPIDNPVVTIIFS